MTIPLQPETLTMLKTLCRGFLAIAGNNQTIGETINIGSKF